MGAFTGLAVEEDAHHSVGGSVAVGVFQSSQEIGHKFVKFHAFFIISRSTLMQGACLLQVFLNIFRDYFSHKVRSFSSL